MEIQEKEDEQGIFNVCYKIEIVKLWDESGWKVKNYEKLRDKRESDDSDNYGYVATTISKTHERVVLAQTIESLNISDVICAINGIEKK